jgi:alpha-glucuronidase
MTEKRISDLEGRTSVLESRMTRAELDGAVRAERHQHVMDTLKTLADNDKQIRDDVRWLLRIVAAAIIGGFLTFALKGGLSGAL